MIIIEITGPKKEMGKLAKQIETLCLTAGHVLRVYDSSVATPPTPEMIAQMGKTATSVVMIKHPQEDV